MIKKTYTYTDFNGEERTEDCYFNLSESELMDLELSVDGGYSERLKKIVAAKNVPEMAKLFKDIIALSYGSKSDDGRRFIKTKDLFDEFSQTPAYTMLYMELVQDDKAANEFLQGVVGK